MKETKVALENENLAKRLELAIGSSGFGCFEFDIARKELKWDRQMYELYGANPETFVPNRESWRACVHPDDRSRTYSLFEKVMAGETVPLFEFRMNRMSDGNLRYFESTGLPEFDSDGVLVRVVGLSRDVTARKNSEMQQAAVLKTMTLIAEKKPLDVILNSIVQDVEAASPSTFCSILLLDQSREHFVLGAGPKVRKFFDEVMAGVKIEPEIGSCSRAVLLNRRVISENLETDVFWAPFYKDAVKHGLAACWSEPIRVSGEVIGTFAMYHANVHSPTVEDIQMIEAAAKTAAVAIQYCRTEEALESQRLKLLASVKMAALGEMASGIAHEINNPLAIIVGKACQLQDRLMESPMDLELFHNELNKVVETSSRIAKVIRGLQSFSRNADQDPLQTVRVSEIIEDALELSGERFKNNHVALRFESEDSELLVAARAAQITQVMLNLLNNAFDAVALKAEKWVEIHAKKVGDSVVISVTDSGAGLSALVAEKAMQPFFTTKEVGRGTGLGLSISKGIVESHRGKIYYDPSSPRTRFVIELPSADVGINEETKSKLAPDQAPS